MKQHSSSGHQRGAGYRCKRALDLLVAVPLAALSGPLVGVAAIAVVAESPGNPFFRQERVGLNRRSFVVYKIRTMPVGNDATGQVWATTAGVTRVGSFLRRLKIDELPQLWNVVRGEMSLVGPRPCLPETAATVDTNGAARFLVRPGLTGLAQISGNINLPWPQRWVLDREYVENCSLVGDVRIILRTFEVIMRGESWAPAS